MKINEFNTAQKKASTVMSHDELNNEQSIINLKDKVHIFNNIYDRNFLILINELAISIQNYHKNYIDQSNLIKTLLNEIENDKTTKIKNVIKEMDLLSAKFYSDAKIVFKKMKLYRNNILKNINQSTLNIKHKKSSSLNINIEVNDKISNLDFKKFSMLDKNGKNEYELNNIDTKKENKENINMSSNDYSFKNNMHLKTKLIEDNNNVGVLIEFFDKILEEIKENEKLNEGIKSLHNFNEFLKEQKNTLINFIKNKNEIKPSTSRGLIVDNEIEKIIEGLSSNINELEKENNRIKSEFQKYKSDEKKKRKFL